MRHFLGSNRANLICHQCSDGYSLPTDSYDLNLIPFYSPMDEDDRYNISCAQAVLWQVTAKDHLVQLVYRLHKLSSPIGTCSSTLSTKRIRRHQIRHVVL